MNALGRFGEDHAARWLQESGCTVLERGWRFGHGEIDLIILDGEDLAFVEVKTAARIIWCVRQRPWGQPSAANS